MPRSGLRTLYSDAWGRMRGSATLRRSFLGWTGLAFVFTAVPTIGIAFVHQASLKSLLGASTATVVWWGLISSVLLGGASLLRVPPDDHLIDRYGVPNGLTVIRVCACLPLMLLATLSLPGRVGLALWCIFGFTSGMLDAADGYVARTIGPLTELGRAMDPASDALFFAGGAVGAVYLGVLPAWVTVLLVVRYLGPLVLAPIVLLARRRPQLVHTKWGRRNTGLTGLVFFCCMWVRIFNGPVDVVALLLAGPLLVPTTVLHFWSLVDRIRHAPVVR